MAATLRKTIPSEPAKVRPVPAVESPAQSPEVVEKTAAEKCPKCQHEDCECYPKPPARPSRLFEGTLDF